MVAERTVRRAEAPGKAAAEGLSPDGPDNDDSRAKPQLHETVRRLDRTPAHYTTLDETQAKTGGCG
jgi:hypothetical protein